MNLVFGINLTGRGMKMGLGAIGAVGSFQSYQPYIYNTNSVSRNSLNAIGKIGNDLTKSHIEFPSDETINPLAKGETANFADVLNSQMQMGMNHAARLFGDESVFMQNA